MSVFPFVVFLVLLAALVGWPLLPAGAWSLEQFTSFLAAALRRNLPLGSSLSAYSQDMPFWQFGKKRALVEIADSVDNGWFFADALDRHPGIFPAGYRALVRAGETGGGLGRVLERLVETVGFEERTSRRVSGYAVYPAMVAFFVLGLILLQRTFIWPRGFWALLGAGRGSGNPASMKLAMRAHVLIAPVALALGLLATENVLKALVVRWLPVDSLGAAWRRLLWHVPLWSRYERRRAVSQYAFAAAGLMQAGVPEHEALSIAAGASANRRFDGMAREAADRVAEGERLSGAFRAVDRRGELPPEFIWYVEVGEESGRLPEAMARASDSAEARAKSALTRLTSLVLPVGIALVGVVVAIVVYAVFDSVGALERLVIEAAMRRG